MARPAINMADVIIRQKIRLDGPVKLKRPRRRVEDHIHSEAVKYLDRLVEMNHQFTFFHPANGGKRDARTGAMMKRLGVKPGVPDLFFQLPGGKSLQVEIKTDDGALTQNQITWRTDMNRLGHSHRVIYEDNSWDLIRELKLILAEFGVDV